MFYREAGQFKASYAEDARIFPIRQDRIGFWVLMLVLGEALLLVCLGGFAGMGLAALLGPGLTAGIGFPPLPIGWQGWGKALATMVIMAVLVGLLPALRAQRLSIVDALAGR